MIALDWATPRNYEFGKGFDLLALSSKSRGEALPLMFVWGVSWISVSRQQKDMLREELLHFEWRMFFDNIALGRTYVKTYEFL